MQGDRRGKHASDLSGSHARVTTGQMHGRLFVLLSSTVLRLLGNKSQNQTESHQNKSLSLSIHFYFHVVLAFF